MHRDPHRVGAVAVRTFVLFYSSFRRPGALNISHETIDGVRTLCGRLVADAETVEADERLASVEDAQGDAFAVACRQGRDAHVEGAASEGQRDAAILRHALLGDVQPAHHLDAGDKRRSDTVASPYGR